jgi:hypothetical protein
MPKERKSDRLLTRDADAPQARARKKGYNLQSLGGLNTKIHAAAEVLGFPSE